MTYNSYPNDPNDALNGGNGRSQGIPSASSVPVFVYRQLAGELQQTRQELEIVTQYNQQLIQQNRLLHQELDKLLQTAQSVQQVMLSISLGTSNIGDPRIHQPPNFTRPPQPPQSPPPPSFSSSLTVTEKDFGESMPIIEASLEPDPEPPLKSSSMPKKEEGKKAKVRINDAESKEKPRAKSKPKPPSVESEGESSSGVSAWFLILLCFFIIASAFSAGYWLMTQTTPGSNTPSVMPSATKK